jgi:hypothetical protein
MVGPVTDPTEIPEPVPQDPDHIDWDSAKFGKMANYATEDDEVETVAYEADDTGETD